MTTNLTISSSQPVPTVGYINYITVSGDPSTTYTITIEPTVTTSLYYNGSSTISTLTFTGTPADLTTTIDSLGLLRSGRPESPVGFIIRDSQSNILFTEVSCYLIGTPIETSRGERAIETLQPGDEVLTYDAGYQPVLWIGWQKVMQRFSGPQKTQPVRIRAGSLGDGMPLVDLYVSPEHSMLIGDQFVHARLLVGCQGITQDSRFDEVQYLHVDLGDHHAILAAGAWSESYAEQGNRGGFQNVDTWAGESRWVPLCRPQVMQSDEALKDIRARLGFWKSSMVA